MGKGFVRFANGLISLAVGLSLLIAGAYAGYCLWDNHQIYAAAENVQDDMIQLKPKIDENAEEEGPSFAELLRVNQDVKAWLTLDNTHIDYPVLQGADNFTYINTDVYGNFALAGSIFIDSRCDQYFADPYTLLHGHHMENSRMFGDLDLYKDLVFFRQYYTGTLVIPGHQWSLRVFACMVVPSSEEKIFNPTLWKKDGVGKLLPFVKAEALHYDADTVTMLEDAIAAGETPPRIIAMATCSSEFTDARTIVLAVMNDYGQENREDV